MVAEKLRETLLGELEHSERQIEILKKTCCTTQRHCLFDDLVVYVRSIKQSMACGEPHSMSESETKKLVRTGEVLGKLAVSCCIPERNAIYFECINRLNGVWMKSGELWARNEGIS